WSPRAATAARKPYPSGTCGTAPPSLYMRSLGSRSATCARTPTSSSTSTPTRPGRTSFELQEARPSPNRNRRPTRNALTCASTEARSSTSACRSRTSRRSTGTPFGCGGCASTDGAATALLAKTAVTVDHLSGGRLEFGIGAAWAEIEHEMYGFDGLDHRVGRLSESLQIIKSLFTQERTNFEGRYYHFKDAIANPKPLQK